jgi:hypothetical protein
MPLSGAVLRPCNPPDHQVKPPETEHTVSVGKLQSWLAGGGKSPHEQVMKSQLRELL